MELNQVPSRPLERLYNRRGLFTTVLAHTSSTTVSTTTDHYLYAQMETRNARSRNTTSLHVTSFTKHLNGTTSREDYDVRAPSLSDGPPGTPPYPYTIREQFKFTVYSRDFFSAPIPTSYGNTMALAIVGGIGFLHGPHNGKEYYGALVLHLAFDQSVGWLARMEPQWCLTEEAVLNALAADIPADRVPWADESTMRTQMGRGRARIHVVHQAMRVNFVLYSMTHEMATSAFRTMAAVYAYIYRDIEVEVGVAPEENALAMLTVGRRVYTSFSGDVVLWFSVSEDGSVSSTFKFYNKDNVPEYRLCRCTTTEQRLAMELRIAADEYVVQDKDHVHRWFYNQAINNKGIQFIFFEDDSGQHRLMMTGKVQGTTRGIEQQLYDYYYVLLDVTDFALIHTTPIHQVRSVWLHFPLYNHAEESPIKYSMAMYAYQTVAEGWVVKVIVKSQKPPTRFGSNQSPVPLYDFTYRIDKVLEYLSYDVETANASVSVYPLFDRETLATYLRRYPSVPYGPELKEVLDLSYPYSISSLQTRSLDRNFWNSMGKAINTFLLNATVPSYELVNDIRRPDFVMHLLPESMRTANGTLSESKPVYADSAFVVSEIRRPLGAREYDDTNLTTRIVPINPLYPRMKVHTAEEVLRFNERPCMRFFTGYVSFVLFSKHNAFTFGNQDKETRMVMYAKQVGHLYTSHGYYGFFVQPQYAYDFDDN